MPLFDLFDNLKSGGFNLIAEKYIKNLVKPYGELVNFNINTKTKHIALSVRLNGETDILSVDISDYQIVQNQDKTYFIPGSVNFSRQWLNDLYLNVFPKMYKNKMIEIPDEYASYAKQLL